MRLLTKTLLFSLLSMQSCFVFASEIQATPSLVSEGQRQCRGDHCQKRDEARLSRREKKIYNKVKDKSWDQLSPKQQKIAQKKGIDSAEKFEAWKAVTAAKVAQQEAQKAAKKMAEQVKINAKAYKKVKNKEWSELTNRELAFAEKNGITTKEQYDQWKAAQAALLPKQQEMTSAVSQPRQPASTTNTSK